jgi:hypothetical protein
MIETTRSGQRDRLEAYPTLRSRASRNVRRLTGCSAGVDRTIAPRVERASRSGTFVGFSHCTRGGRKAPVRTEPLPPLDALSLEAIQAFDKMSAFHLPSCQAIQPTGLSKPNRRQVSQSTYSRGEIFYRLDPSRSIATRSSDLFGSAEKSHN